MKEREPWHLDKKVPLALILMIFVQTASAFYWGGNLESRVDNLEQHSQVVSDLTDRIISVEGAVIRLDTTLKYLDVTLNKLEKHLEKRER